MKLFVKEQMEQKALDKPTLKREETEMVNVSIDETPSEEIKEETEEEKQIREMKEKAMKCKVIALEDLGHPPLSNPSLFSKRDKKKVLDKMTLWYNTKSDEEIDEEFNDIVLDKVFSNNDDYTKYSIAGNKVGIPELPPDMMVRDVAGNYIDAEVINKDIRERNDKVFNEPTK